jgi:LPXTG-motif cell wall-anchored protein
LIKRLAILLSLMSLGTVGLAVGMPSANADPYTAQVNTQCEVSTPVAKRGDRFETTARVRANGTTVPTGKVTVKLRRTPGGEIWKKTVPYTGSNLHIVGPALDTAGDYRATATYHPADRSLFRGCSGSAAFSVTKGSSPDQEDPDDGDGGPLGGILPDTGGPNVLWLILGLALVGTGGGAVVVARRGGVRSREATEA